MGADAPDCVRMRGWEAQRVACTRKAGDSSVQEGEYSLGLERKWRVVQLGAVRRPALDVT